MSLDSEEQQKSRVLQPKTNISAHQAGMYGTALTGTAVSPKLQHQPVKTATSPAQPPMSLSDTAFELHSSHDWGDVAQSASETDLGNMHLAHSLSIPGQVDAHEGNAAIARVTEEVHSAEAVSTPRQVQMHEDRSVLPQLITSYIMHSDK